MRIVFRTLTLLSIVACISWFGASRLAENENVAVPEYYRNLDTNLPFNDLASKSLDPKISNAEYDAIRWQYFKDRVAPQFSPIELNPAWEDFKQRTERPDYPGRQKTLSDYLLMWRWAFVACALFLVFRFCFAIWSGVLKPAGVIILEDGVYGLARMVLFGKKELLPKMKGSEGSNENVPH